MASPSPVPSNFRAKELSIWLKAWKSLVMFSTEIPIPLSRIFSSTNSLKSLSGSGNDCTGQPPAIKPTELCGYPRGATG